LDSSDKTLANVKHLAMNIEIFEFMVPQPQIPQWLYRGLEYLSKQPEPGQTVRYTTKRPATGWSTDPNVARSFCGHHEGIIMKVSGKKLLQHGALLFWPNTNKELNGFVSGFFKSNEKEWGVMLTKPMVVDDWNTSCDPKFTKSKTKVFDI